VSHRAADATGSSRDHGKFAMEVKRV